MACSRLVVSAAVLCAIAGSAHAQLRVATWNISNYTGSDRAADIQTAVYGTNAANGLSMRPDVIAVQEMVGAGALATLVNVLNTAPGSPGDWASAPYLDDPNYVDTESSFVYRTTRVQLVGSFVIADANGTTTDQPRSTYRYDFRPVGYTSAGATTGIYSVHLKAGSASTDNDRRLIETTRIRHNAEGQNTNPNDTIFDGLPAGYNFIMAGDTNMQNASQTSYVQLVGSQAVNTGRFFDPIHEGNNSSATGDNGSWNNNASYNFIHTQDPANAGGGGMDDRHDQILVSASLINGQGLDYIGNSNIAYSSTAWNDPNHSYRCWGNDGTSYNVGLTTTGNTMVGATIAQALINVATASGGHLPVYLDMRVPAKVSANATVLDFGSVVQGSAAPTRTLQVSNAGDIVKWTVAGIDGLDYSLSLAGSGFTAPSGSFSDAAGGGVNSHVLSMPTSTVGPKNATLTINSDDPDQPTLVVTLVGTVTAPNQVPNADAGADQTVTDSDNSGSESVTLNGSLSNDPDGTITQYLWKEGVTNLAPASASPTLVTNLNVGTHTITLQVTDNGGATDTDTLVVTILPGAVGCDSIDFNGDGLMPDTADIDDFLSVFSGGPCSTGTCNDIDFNNDGLFPDSADIDSMLSVFSGGPCL